MTIMALPRGIWSNDYFAMDSLEFVITLENNEK